MVSLSSRFKLPISIVKWIALGTSLQNSYEILFCISLGCLVYTLSLILGAIWYITGRKCS